MPDDPVFARRSSAKVEPPGYNRRVKKRKLKKRSSEKRNTSTKRRWGRGEYYSFGELFMAGVGALLIVLFLGIVITSLLGD
jgi:hypothetical protein